MLPGAPSLLFLGGGHGREGGETSPHSPVLWCHRGHQYPPSRTRVTGLDVVAPLFTPEGQGRGARRRKQDSPSSITPSRKSQQSLRERQDFGENKG